MDSELDSDGDLRRVITLAAALERASREGAPVAALLDELERAAERLAPPADECQHLARWQRVVASVRRDVESGCVRSVTGVSREARRLALQLDRPARELAVSAPADPV